MIDKAARLTKIKSLATAFKQKHPHLIGQKIKVVEVGPRDGLQNQKEILSLTDKLNLINKLSKTGLRTIQVGSFVSPKWVPQMANSLQLFQQIIKEDGVSYPCLVPNEKGMQSAIKAGVKQIAIFASATQGFSKKNLNCSIDESFERFKPVLDSAKQKGIQVRGYVSMVMGCPFDGDVNPSKVKQVVEKLLSVGCYEVSLGDTIGKGTPQLTSNLFRQLSTLPQNKLAAHFHDTFDNAIENIFTAISYGIEYLIQDVEQLIHLLEAQEGAPIQRLQEEMYAHKMSCLPFRMLAQVQKSTLTNQIILENRYVKPLIGHHYLYFDYFQIKYWLNLLNIQWYEQSQNTINFQNMEDSSHLMNSSKFRKRKPIFDKEDHSPVNKLTHNMINSVSKLTNSYRNSDMLSSQTKPMPKPQCQNSHVIHTNLINNSHPHLRVSFSQPKMVTQTNQPIIYQQRPIIARPTTPQPLVNQYPPTVFQDKKIFNQTFSPHINIQPSLKQEFYHTSPVKMTTVIRKPRTQFRKEEIQQNNQRDSPVFVSRVMKQIQPNLQIERHFAPSDTGSNSFDNSFSHLKSNNANTRDTSKMQEINSLLSENYNILYNQFFNLKQDIKQKDIIEEQSFLHYSSRQIENIFKNQTKKAIFQLETIYRGNAQKPLKKVCKNRSMVWGSHCLI